MTTPPNAPAARHRYQGEWDVEIPGAPDALEMLREAANDPETTDDEFDVLADQLFRAGFFPDRLVRPSEPGGYTKDGIVHLIGLGGNEVLRDILCDEPRKPRNEETPEPSSPSPEPSQPQDVTVAAEDEDEDEDEDEEDDDDGNTGNCPLCGTQDCPDHLLACFDVTFADAGEGNHGIGVVNGPLYDVEEIGEVLDLARLAWVRSVRTAGSPTSPPWIDEVPGLSGYFDALGDSGDFDIADHDDDEDAARELAGSTDYHSIRAREFLEEALIACGWSGETSEEEFDGLGQSTIYLSWWDADPRSRATELQALLKVILVKAASGKE